jgi:2-dehydro-3-deoxygalactonokinase
MSTSKSPHLAPDSIALTRPLIAVDWGTTSLRAALILNNQVQEERASDQGIMNVSTGDFPAVLSQICSQWRDIEDVLILICGMAGSAQGWQLAPYCPCPVTLNYLANHLHWINPHKIGIVPGLSIEHTHAPDVIRGEEVQVLGALSLLNKQSARLVLPGTHSKWVDVKRGKIVGFSTFMTGEFFSLLKEHSILSKTLAQNMDDAPFDEQAFNKGLELSLHSRIKKSRARVQTPQDITQSLPQKSGYKPNLLHDIFGIRTLALFERNTPQQLLHQLSGLVIGYELQTQNFKKGEQVIVVCAPALQLCYAHALKRLGVSVITLGSQATWRGFQVIAQSIGSSRSY